LQKHFGPPEITRLRRCGAPTGERPLATKGGVKGGSSGREGRVRRARTGLVRSDRNR